MIFRMHFHVENHLKALILKHQQITYVIITIVVVVFIIITIIIIIIIIIITTNNPTIQVQERIGLDIHLATCMQQSLILN